MTRWQALVGGWQEEPLSDAARTNGGYGRRTHISNATQANLEF